MVHDNGLLLLYELLSTLCLQNQFVIINNKQLEIQADRQMCDNTMHGVVYYTMIVYTQSFLQFLMTKTVP